MCQASFLVHLLSILSVANALYTLNRKRHYRLFESSVDAVPSTPSAKRVRVDSSPVASSPLRFLSTILVGDSAESRSHPAATRDVWEIAVWDPTPFALQMFCLLSPGHALVYWLFLPTAIADPRPSTTVLTTIVLAALLSGQLLLLCSSFSQQSKDASVIHKEVMSEYDIKYVHPRTQPLMRDVGTQFSTSTDSHRRTSAVDIEDESVDTYTPTFVINRHFQTRPNPNYAKHVDPDGFSSRPPPSQGTSTGVSNSLHTPAHLRDVSSPIRPQPQTAIRQPQFRPPTVGDGGSLGVYTHANSPLRNSRSADLLDPAGQRENLGPQIQKRQGSPLKRSSMAPTANGHRFGHPKASQPRRESDMF